MFNRRAPQPISTDAGESDAGESGELLVEPVELYPLAWLALDLGTTAARLAELCRTMVRPDDWHRPAIPLAVARDMCRDHHDAAAADAERQARAQADWQQRMAAQLGDPAARIRALQRAQQRRDDGGDDADAVTLWDRLGYTAERDRELERQADKRAALARGESTGGTFRVVHDQDG